jgi:3-hydroxyacyl-[acyl-carrier-protein] dehydratase
MKPSTQTYDGIFHFDPGDPIYEDHFPGRPVVPGSLIVQAFVKTAESLPDAFKVTKVENFRFKRFVVPGTYSYHLDLRQDGKSGSSIRCRLLEGDQVVVSGVLA